MNACHTGEVCRIYLARINNDLTMQHVASFGFSDDFIQSHKKTTIMEAQTLLRAINESALVIEPSQEVFDKSRKTAAVWKTNIYLPLLPNFAAIISTQCRLSNNEENYSYFEALRSVINLYTNLLHQVKPSGLQSNNRSKIIAVGDKLTERQEVILAMVKEGMTNNEIADKLGYSESLIRQETIAIYQKLGVDGRRDLIKSKATQR